MRLTLPDPAWYKALTLRERAELWRAGRLDSSAPADAHDQVGVRIAAWRSQPPFDRDSGWSERLAAEGLDEPALRAILSATPHDLRSAVGDPPSWAIELDEAYAIGSGFGETSMDDLIPWPESARRETTVRFLALFVPLIHRARRRLAAGLAALPIPGSVTEIDCLLVAALPLGLATMLERTAVLELHVAKLQGRLTGDTPGARFDAFVSLLSDRAFARSLLLEYPVLGRRAAEFIQTWLERSLELMRRLTDDWDLLRSSVLGPDPGRLTTLDLEAGDTHRGGRSVAILGFASGERVVYKPRPLAMEARFQELLAWVESRGADPTFRTLTVIERGDYGWMEFAAGSGCASVEQIERYFQRLGGLLAVLHVTGAMDFHFQNVVAAGEHPVAVDLESLFHPTLPAAPFSRPGERLAARALGDSVLRVGMLPFRVSETEGGRQDWSGVASVAGQTSPDPMLEWERAGTDEMHAVKRLLPMKGARNRPTIDGREAEAADHREAIVAGFERTHRLLTEHKGALLAPDGPLERCADATSRVVLRTTRGYALMLDESWHPDFMRDALDRDRFLDRLWVGSDDMPAWRRAAAHDHRDLWREDIPWYGARPESRDLWTSTGERLPQFFPESGLEWSRRRLHEMDDDDRLRQSWLARSALDTLLLHSERAEPAGYALDEADASRGDGMRSRLIEQAVKLGEWFERTAFRDGSDLIWIALDMRDGFWSLYPCSEDLYSGVPGIALFLAHLGWVSDQERFVSLARRGMTTLLEKLEAAPGQVPFIGLYQGWGSAIAALAHVGAVTGDEATLVAAERLVPRVGERIEHDRVLDVVGGAAGAIAALLALHRVSASSAALEAAMRGGEHLLASARRSAHGVFWLTELGGDEPLSGFAHGASGIAAALSRLAIATGDRRFLEAALVGLAFEREAMRATAGSDRVGIRDATHTRFEPGTWCYGAPGTGFARLTALDAIEALDPRNEHRAALRADVDEAIAITLEHGFGRSHCLCHGDLGNLDFLIEAERRLPDRALRIPIDQITSSVLADCSRHGWRCGTAAGLVSPALMNGLAGIGYGLLRVADPERIPSVLAMEPPRTARPAVVVNA